MKNNIKWMIVFSVVIIICCCVMLFGNATKDNTCAIIKSNGKTVRKIDLSSLNEPVEFTITGNGGYNIIRAEKGKIAVIDSDCKDKICVKRGWVSGGPLPIVCLPHGISVTFEGKTEVDAVAGGQ